jgi:hypothetical protein
VRATLACGPPRLLRDWDSALTVRRPKPLIPLSTAPHRVSAKSSSSFPPATIALAPISRANANTGAVIRITTSDTNSLGVIAFMRFCVTSADLLSRCPWPASQHRHNKRRATAASSPKEQCRRNSCDPLMSLLSPGVNRKLRHKQRRRKCMTHERSAFLSCYGCSPRLTSRCRNVSVTATQRTKKRKASEILLECLVTILCSDTPLNCARCETVNPALCLPGESP